MKINDANDIMKDLKHVVIGTLCATCCGYMLTLLRRSGIRFEQGHQNH